MVQRVGVGAADIHARPAPHRLQPLQNLDRGRVVFALSGRARAERRLALGGRNLTGRRRAAKQVVGHAGSEFRIVWAALYHSGDENEKRTTTEQASGRRRRRTLAMKADPSRVIPHSASPTRPSRTTRKRARDCSPNWPLRPRGWVSGRRISTQGVPGRDCRGSKFAHRRFGNVWQKPGGSRLRIEDRDFAFAREEWRSR